MSAQSMLANLREENARLREDTRDLTCVCESLRDVNLRLRGALIAAGVHENLVDAVEKG